MAGNWGGLNNALAAWRLGLNELFPRRSTRSDGARADGNHASTSQHQPDADGTVDAFDEDRNYLASSDQDGNALEDRIKAALDLDFMADARAHLIISDRKIRNSEIGNWRARDYTGASPHTEHTHRQVHQSREDDGRAWKFTHTRALLRELEEDDMTVAEVREGIEEARPYGIARIKDRGWAPTSLRRMVEYVFESLVASGDGDVDGDGDKEPLAAQSRFDRLEGEVREIKELLTELAANQGVVRKR